MKLDLYLRHEDEPRGRKIGTGDLDDIDELINAIPKWGVATDGEVSSGEVVGQFFVDDRGAGFELIIVGDE